MKILLIQAHTGEKCSLYNKIVYTSLHPSFTLNQLAATISDKYEVDMVDERYQSVSALSLSGKGN